MRRKNATRERPKDAR